MGEIGAIIRCFRAAVTVPRLQDRQLAAHTDVIERPLPAEHGDAVGRHRISPIPIGAYNAKFFMPAIWLITPMPSAPVAM